MDNELISILSSSKQGKFNVTHRIYNEFNKGSKYLLFNKVSNNLLLN
jgi:hypothetical protein